MRTNAILLKVYSLSTLVVGFFILCASLWLHYQPRLVLVELCTSIVIGAPSVIALHAICLLMQRLGLSRAAAWMLLFASVPLLSLVPARLFVQLVPGNTAVLLLLGMLGAYAALLGQGLSISKMFNRFLEG